MSQQERVNVLICSALSEELVADIARVDDRLEVVFKSELLPAPRYEADHHGAVRPLGADQLAEWQSLLAQAEVSFDFDWLAPTEMIRNCPRLHWIQATSAGIGEFVERADFQPTDVLLTTAAGVHAIPLAEFALMGALHFVKGMPFLSERKATKNWARYTTRQLAGQRALVVGLGHAGRHVVRSFSALGVEVWGVGRDGRRYVVPEARRVIGISNLDDVLPNVDLLVLACPLTAETRGLLDERRLRSMRRGGIVINIARGPVIDEQALVDALTDGHLGGACLDVFAVEPLPLDSPLWGMSNVIVSPHSASTVDRENAAITELFCDNLRRYLADQPLRNLYSFADGY